MNAILKLELEDLVQHILEKLPQVLRPLSRFSRVFRQLLEHRPLVQQWPPVDVTDVH